MQLTCSDEQHGLLTDLLAQHFAAQHRSTSAQRVPDDAADGGAKRLVFGGKCDGGDLAAVAPFSEKLK
jgi:hypothetical protein